ncbi:DUF935 domain-containing protein [Roseospira goensis]|uniref:Phage gp29-like protein n=1 Tax=Roseospira goensis TaxID=391922 RepID=A0A7W6WMC2_9PROT|nr:DUF935 domain-containing protein [Roseospira goensis]MBB4287789.1 phage gp29-like protein [Roseospira goensis]
MRKPTPSRAPVRPLKRAPATLTREIAAPELVGTRTVWHDSYAAGLTPARLARILRAAMEGDTHEYLVLAGEIERLELHYRAQLGTRKLQVKSLQIMVEAATDDPADVQRADAVRNLVARPGTRRMIGHLLDGLARGYSVVELVWDTTGAPWMPRFEWRDPTFFHLDRVTGQEIRLRDGTPDGAPLPPHKFLIHVPDLITGLPIAGGLAMLGVWAFMFKSFSLQDWAAFGEIYGMPIRLGRFDQAHSPEDRAILRQAVTMIGRQAAAILPRDMDIQFIDAAKGAVGPDVFQRLAEYWDAQVSKVILGQTMTADDGSSLAQARVHNEVRLDILEADAGDISETLQRDLVAPFIDLNFGRPNHGLYPTIRLLVPDMDDTRQWVGMVCDLVDRGMTVGMSTVRDKLGLPDPDPDEALLHPPGAALGPAPAPGDEDGLPVGQATARATARQSADDPDPIDDLRDDLLDDWEPAMAPVVDPLVEALRGASSFEEALALLPQVADRMDLSALVDALTTATAAGRAVGVLEAQDRGDGGDGDG